MKNFGICLNRVYLATNQLQQLRIGTHNKLNMASETWVNNVQKGPSFLSINIIRDRPKLLGKSRIVKATFTLDNQVDRSEHFDITFT